jgi:hypothetical protein
LVFENVSHLLVDLLDLLDLLILQYPSRIYPLMENLEGGRMVVLEGSCTGRLDELAIERAVKVWGGQAEEVLVEDEWTLFLAFADQDRDHLVSPIGGEERELSLCCGAAGCHRNHCYELGCCFVADVKLALRLSKEVGCWDWESWDCVSDCKRGIGLPDLRQGSRLAVLVSHTLIDRVEGPSTTQKHSGAG